MRIIPTFITLVCVASAGNALASSAPHATAHASQSVSIAAQIDAVARRLDADALRSTREPLALAVATGIDEALRTQAETLTAAAEISEGAVARQAMCVRASSTLPCARVGATAVCVSVVRAI